MANKKNLQELTYQELQVKLTDTKKELENLHISHKVTPLENPNQIRTMRRTIARIHTAIQSHQNQAPAAQPATEATKA